MKISSISKPQIPMTNDQVSSKIQNPKQLLKKYEIKPSKRLGQNFLVDELTLNKIVETADLSSNDTVLEIGSGLGILTLELAKRVNRVIAVEKDRKLYYILREILKDQNINNVETINGDILKISNLAYRQAGQIQNSNYKIVANLPYYITSPVIRKFLENPPADRKPGFMVLMVQKEVAQRICAEPPKMSLLSIAVQFYAEPKIISYVSKKYFYPQPKVDSAIIKIIPKEIPKIDTEKFFGLIKRGFSAKRKMLKNNLSGFDFEKIGLNPKIRAENLTIDNWLKIYEAIQ